MKGLAELVVSLCDLCEAEGRLLEAGVLRTVRRAGLYSVGLLFGAAALALLLGALYALLAALLPAPAVLAILGVASAALAGVFLWRASGGRKAPAVPQARPGASGTTADEAARPAAAPAPRKEGGAPSPWEAAAPYGRSAGAPGRPQAMPGTERK